jgi:ribosome biogenesis GTPase A
VKEKAIGSANFHHPSHVKIERNKTATAKRDLIVINKIDFAAKNLTSNAGIFLLFGNAKTHGIFDLIENDLVFDNESTNKIKMTAQTSTR